MKRQIPLSKDKFIELMTKLEDDDRKTDELSAVLNKLYGTTSGFCIDFYPTMELRSGLLNLLETIFEDWGGWISYYICECDYGKNETYSTSVTEEDGSHIPFKTYEDLYDLLIKNYLGHKNRARSELRFL